MSSNVVIPVPNVGKLYETRLKKSKAEIKKKPPRRVFHAISGHPGDYQADIAFMRFRQSAKYVKANQGYTCLFLAVEVPTRFAYAVPMKTKSSTEVCHALQKVYNAVTDDNKLFLNITTDEGPEFNNSQWDNMISDLKVTQYVKEPGDRYSLGIIDRLTRTLKDWIRDWQVENENLSWYESLQAIIKKYNQHQIRTLKQSPTELATYGDAFNKAQKLTKQKDKPAQKKFGSFTVGDFVRIRLRPEDQPGELGKRVAKVIKGRDHWSNKVYVIDKITGLSFCLSTVLGEAAPRTYRSHELMKVTDESTDIPEIYQSVVKQARNAKE